MADIENLKRLAEESKDSGEWFEEGCALYSYYEKVDADFIVAANPAAILELIAENDALRASNSGNELALLRMGFRQACEKRDQLKAELERVREDSEALLKVCTGEIKHLYRGMCPDAVEGPDVRDPECPACAAMGKGGRADA